ncbi:MAG: DNA-3-methyladenine glycosylase [bacterium]|nr:DNA-3-methyladenine glycosylase [bacterium]
MSKKLPRSFYNRPTLEVAPDLLGKHIVYRSSERRLSARIVEVEAYIGENDPACHAAPGPTKRNRVMFGRAGFSYVYLIYGMYHCFNLVTEREGFPAAVLLRAAEPIEGFELMKKLSPKSGRKDILSGPGKFCRAFGLTVAQSGVDLAGRELFVEDPGDSVTNIVTSGRIGIKKGKEHPWRFMDGDSFSRSKPR